MIVKNPNPQHISISGYWEIQFFDDRQKSLKTEKEHEFLSLSGREEEEFSQSFIPYNATFCKARYLK